MKIQIRYINDRRHQGWWFYWQGMRLFSTKAEAQVALDALLAKYQ